jgi:GntR family transcriptional regulator, transcriptional repressor for pyruvate dehydrogenase complex
MMEKTEEDAMFGPVVREPRLSDKVAEMLLDTITARGLKPGERLPSERELGEQFGVSRTVIREAVRALAAKGVIEARTGSGLRVAAVEASAVSESMGLFLRGARLEYPKIHEVRTTLEVEVAGLAAERATVEDIDGLAENLSRTRASLKDVDALALLDVEFHRRVVEASHNELYLVVIDSIGEILLEIRRLTQGIPGRPQKAVRAHRTILRAIESHSPEDARRAMREHLDESLSAWLRHPPGAAS